MGEFKIIDKGSSSAIPFHIDDKMAEKIAKETEHSVIKYKKFKMPGGPDEENVYVIVDKNEEPVDGQALLRLRKKYNFKFIV